MEQIRIKNLGEIYTGKTPPTADESNFGNDYPFVTPGDLVTDKYIHSTERFVSSKGIKHTTIIPKNSVCVSCIGYIGKIGITIQESCTNQQINSIVPNENFDTNYVYYLLVYNVPYFKELAGVNVLAQLNKSDFSKIKLQATKNQKEQTAIAGILSKVDEAISTTKNSIKAAEKLKKALMQNLLTGKLKPDGAKRPKNELIITKYGTAHKDWKYCKINDLIREKYITKVQDGNHGEIHPVSAEFVDDGISFVMASDISKGFINHKKCKKITFERAEKLRIGFAKKGDVLISHKASIGYTCIVDDVEPYVMLTPQVTYYRTDQSKLLPEYLLYFFQQYSFQNLMEGYAKQSTRNYIGITNQKKMWIYLPDSIEEQEEMIIPIRKIDLRIIKQEEKIENLERLKTSLMQNLLTGKKQVDVEKTNQLLNAN